MVSQAMHNVCCNQDVLWTPASPAGSPCPSGCCSRPARWSRIILGLLPEVGVLSLSTDPPSCCPRPSPLPHPTMRMRGQHPPHVGWGCPGRSPLCCEISSFGISVAAGVQLILHMSGFTPSTAQRVTGAVLPSGGLRMASRHGSRDCQGQGDVWGCLLLPGECSICHGWGLGLSVGTGS